jgi:hypothetical protein
MKHIEPRVYSDNQYQEIAMMDCWYTLLDIHNAVQYGFVDNRLAEPGRTIDTQDAEIHVAHVENEWEAEKQKRDFSNEWTGAPPLTKMPLNAKLYLHTVLVDEWSKNRIERNPPAVY